MTYTPEQLEAYRQDVHDDNVDNGHMAVVFLDALDTILTLRQENSDLNATNVKLGTDLLGAWTERDAALQKEVGATHEVWELGENLDAAVAEITNLRTEKEQLLKAWNTLYCARCSAASSDDERCPGCGADNDS